MVSGEYLLEVKSIIDNDDMGYTKMKIKTTDRELYALWCFEYNELNQRVYDDNLKKFCERNNINVELYKSNVRISVR